MRGVSLLIVAASSLVASGAASAEGGETVEQAICRLVDASAKARELPPEFLTRLIWQESSFRPNVVSPAGAQGVAQFMPGTARARGLSDPFDPEQAIPAGAAYVAELSRQFGNRGLGAAAYNAGPTRVATWIAGKGGLPDETRAYVVRITGRSAEDWLADTKGKAPPAETGTKPATPTPEAAGPPAPAADPAPPAATPAPAKAEPTCLQVTAELRRTSTRLAALIEGVVAPWGVQLAGSFSKGMALAAFDRHRRAYAAVLGDVQPMIIGTRLRSRGFRPFYRVRVPAQTRQAANAICARLVSAGGACAVLRS